MRRIETWLRSIMLQELFTNISIIHTERGILNNIDKEKILNEFASANNNSNNNKKNTINILKYKIIL